VFSGYIRDSVLKGQIKILRSLRKLMTESAVCMECKKSVSEETKLRSGNCTVCDEYISKVCEECFDMFEYLHDHLGH
jgi:hypothetical protein